MILKVKQIGTFKTIDVLIDKEDFEKVSGFNWFIDLRGGYVSASKKIDGKAKTFKLHQLVFGKTTGFEIDHINRNKLDNRKENLRHVTHHENCLNRKRGEGVSFRNDRNKWRARIKIKGKEIHLGYFDTKDEALKIRKEKAILVFGKYAFV